MASCPHCNSLITSETQRCPTCGDWLSPSPDDPDKTLITKKRPDPEDQIQRQIEEETNHGLSIIEKIGGGGMGWVYKAQQRVPKRFVAVKVLRPDLQSNPEIAQRFKNEADTQSNLSHPNILTILEVHGGPKLTFFTSTYVPSVSLRTYLKENPRPPFPEVVRILRELGRALAFAHRHSVIHRDVKPENVIVENETRRMILTDFGIAKNVSGPDSGLTGGSVLGTPLYMAPEQAEDPSTIDGRADQYSLGLIGYEMLSGKPVFDAKTHIDMLHSQKYEQPRNVRAIRPDAPDWLCRAIMRAIEKQPERRFPSMEGFLDTLEGRRSGGPAAFLRLMWGKVLVFLNSMWGKILVFVLTVLLTALAFVAISRLL